MSQISARAFARIAMAMLPHADAAKVRFPGRPSYADIAPPRKASEFVARIEEVERSIWRAAAGGERLSSDGLLPAS